MFEKKEEEKNSNEDLLNDLLKTDHRKVVENIFSDDKNNDKTVHLKKGGFLKMAIISLSVLLFVALGSFAFVFYGFNKTVDTNKNISDSSKQIILNINSIAGVSDSGEIEYSVSFKNTEKYTMKNIKVVARFPDEFSYVSSDLDPISVTDKNIEWDFDYLSPDEEKAIVLKGTLFGQVGIDSILSASMDYNFDTLSSSFSSSNSYKITITKPVIDVVVSRDDIFYKDKEISYKIKIKNNSLKALKNVKVSFHYPESFKVNSYSEVPYKEYKGEQAFWVFDLNKKQQDKTDVNSDDYYEKIIEVKAVVSSDKVLDVNLLVDAGIVIDMSNVDEIDKMFSKEDVIRTSASGLSFSVIASSEIANDNNGNPISVVNINDPYKLSFKYQKTNKDLSFKDLRLVVEFLGDDIIDPKIITTSKPTNTVSDSNGLSNLVLEWNGSNEPSLKNLLDTQKSLDISLNLKKDLLSKHKDGGYYSNVKVSLFGKNINSTNEILLVDYKTFRMVVGSNFVVKNSTIYNKSIKSEVKTDPIEFDLNISNSYNNLSGVGVYFNLPDGVEYSGDAVLSSSNKFDYDPQTKKISWVVGDVGANVSNIVGKFYVTLTPSKDSIGKYVDLTSKINLVYKDTVINKDFSLDIDSVKTNKKTIK